MLFSSTGRIARNRVGMYVRRTVEPGSTPWRVVHNDNMFPPAESGCVPAPRHKRSSQRNPETEPDRTCNNEAPARRSIHNQRVVIRNDDVIRIDRSYLNVGSRNHDNLTAGSQIAIAVSLLAVALNGVHDFSGLCQKCIPQFLRPLHGRGHHIQNRRKREQGLNTWIPLKWILPPPGDQPWPRQVMS